MFEIAKKGQGLIVRRVAFWGFVILIVWGGQSLYTWLISTFDFAKTPLGGGKPADAWTIPVLEQRFNWGFVVSWLVIILSIFALVKILNREKTTDFLIETDDEVKKVTWPSWKDAWQSSIIVVVFVVTLTSFLLISDGLLNYAIRLILL